MGWPVVSADIPTAFLQGKPLDVEATHDGSQRLAAMGPPKDVWGLLPPDWQFWPGTEVADFCWRPRL